MSAALVRRGALRRAVLATVLMPMHALLAQPTPQLTDPDRYPVPWEIENVRMIRPPTRGLADEPRCSPPITHGFLALLLEETAPSRGRGDRAVPLHAPLPWCTAAFTWRSQRYRVDLFVGGSGRLVFPDGSTRPFVWGGERGADRDGVIRDMDAPPIRSFIRFLKLHGLAVRPQVRHMRHWQVRLPGTGPDAWLDVALLALPPGWTKDNVDRRMYSVPGHYNAAAQLYLFDYDGAPERAAVRSRVRELFKCYPHCGPAPLPGRSP
jgi:hypothetical protein